MTDNACPHPEPSQLAGVYLLTPNCEFGAFDEVLSVVEQALHAGVRVVQYRDKAAGTTQRIDRAGRIVALAHAAGALLIVNDSVEVALSIAADGVHLGRDDGDVLVARNRLPGRLVGVSCYNDLANAHRAIAAGADAIAFGSMFASVTKPAAVHAPLALLTEARSAWPRQRVIAIGGINRDNIATVAEAGAHAAAVLDAVFSAERPAQAARELVEQFDKGRRRNEEQRTTV